MIKVDRNKIVKIAAVVNGALSMPNLPEKLAQMDRKATVDKVLSLGMINAKNIELFIGGIDELDSVVQFLASLLVSCRIGFPVDEGAVKDSLFSLSDIVDQLRTIRASTVRPAM